MPVEVHFSTGQQATCPVPRWGGGRIASGENREVAGKPWPGPSCSGDTAVLQEWPQPCSPRSQGPCPVFLHPRFWGWPLPAQHPGPHTSLHGEDPENHLLGAEGWDENLPLLSLLPAPGAGRRLQEGDFHRLLLLPLGVSILVSTFTEEETGSRGTGWCDDARVCPRALATHLSACSEELFPTGDWKRAGKRLAMVDARMQVGFPPWSRKSQAPPAMPWRPLSQILIPLPRRPSSAFLVLLPMFFIDQGNVT